MKSRYGMELRAAGSADAEGLAALLRAGGLSVAAPTLATRLDPGGGLRGIAPSTVLIAAEWGPPSGVIAAHWFAPLLGPVVGEVTLLLVDPERRRQGIARLLLKAVAQAARSAGCDRLLLGVPEEGRGLDEFCAATGFTREGGRFERGLRKASGRAVGMSWDSA